MKALLTFALAVFALSSSFAAPTDPDIEPQNPGPAKEKRQRIYDEIQQAQDLEKDVRSLEAAYRAVRNGADKVAAFEALERYSDKLAEQGALYADAALLTQILYGISVGKIDAPIGKPYDPQIQWMSGKIDGQDAVLHQFSPQVTESGPGVRLGSHERLRWSRPLQWGSQYQPVRARWETSVDSAGWASLHRQRNVRDRSPSTETGTSGCRYLP